MATARISNRKRRENYLVFNRIKDKHDALAFLKERLMSPAGDLHYTPSNHRWETMPLVLALRKTHRRKQSSLEALFILLDAFKCAGIALVLLSALDTFVADQNQEMPQHLVAGAMFIIPAVLMFILTSHKEKANEDFWGRDKMVLHVFAQSQHATFEPIDPLTDWVKSRYDIDRHSYVRPPTEYTYTSAEEIEEAKEKDAAPFDPRLQAGLDEKLYSWKKVGVTKEGANRRTHCILIDKETGLEAPLLPGVQPYE